MVSSPMAWLEGKGGSRAQEEAGSCSAHSKAALFYPQPLGGVAGLMTPSDPASPPEWPPSDKVTVGPSLPGSLTELEGAAGSPSAQKRKTDFWSEVTAEVVGVLFK